MGILDEPFFQHLASLPNGPARVAACKAYKADSYKLNASLKAVSAVNYVKVCDLLAAFRARANHPMTLYRMTSNVEFCANVVRLLIDRVIIYPAFMSTTRTETRLARYIPSCGTPLILEIQIPAGFPIAFLDPDGTLPEDERLLPAGIELSVLKGPDQITRPEDLRDVLPGAAGSHTLAYRMTLTATALPVPLRSLPETEIFAFSDDDM